MIAFENDQKAYKTIQNLYIKAKFKGNFKVNLKAKKIPKVRYGQLNVGDIIVDTLVGVKVRYVKVVVIKRTKDRTYFLARYQHKDRKNDTAGIQSSKNWHLVLWGGVLRSSGAKLRKATTRCKINNKTTARSGGFDCVI